ncbi:MAG: hypothetical protein HON43_05470 [Alphaproteobacteria bacterium]|jgi:hypothetical protein|nr:hypothetical protein [Alphaproteobacteria bacterium]MBT5390265.1 hypothetical protein [Alphaproteobacteria bacterium]
MIKVIFLCLTVFSVFQNHALGENQHNSPFFTPDEMKELWGKLDYIPPDSLALEGIIFRDEHNWICWINGHKVTAETQSSEQIAKL